MADRYVATGPLDVGSPEVESVDEDGHVTSKVLHFEEGDEVPAAIVAEAPWLVDADRVAKKASRSTASSDAKPKSTRRKSTARRST